MERIQSAIDKARAARKAQPEAAALPAGLPAGAAPEAAPADASAAAWAALPGLSPDARHLERHRGVSLTGGAAAVPFDGMRTRLLHMAREQGWRRIAITSPGAGCGKTTICLNLAFSLGRLAHVRTLLIDTDLRRPGIARVLGDGSGHQIADVLAGRADPARHLVRVGDTLAIGTNRVPVPNPAELLQGPEAAAALERIEAIYRPDLMLFDMPPMLVSDDTMAAMGLMDGVLLVAAAETTTLAEIDRCEQELASRTNVVGIVLNKCRYMPRGEGYGYGYGYS